jgi:hypothetical protein
MGKWSEIAAALPRREEEPGAFREKVNTFKDAQRVKTLDELAAAYREVRREKTELEKDETDLNVRQMALEALITEAFLAENREGGYYFSDGGRIDVSDQISVRAADQEAVTEWAKTHGYERMLTLNAKRLEGLTKAALESGDAIPDGVVVTAYSQVKLASK